MWIWDTELFDTTGLSSNQQFSFVDHQDLESIPFNDIYDAQPVSHGHPADVVRHRTRRSSSKLQVVPHAGGSSVRRGVGT